MFSYPRMGRASEGEYKFVMGMNKTLYVLGTVAAAAGLVGLGIEKVGSADSELIQKIAEYSKPALLGGVLISLNFGLQYFINKDLNKDRKRQS